MIQGLWYYCFSGGFVLYQLDVILYSIIALIARIYQALRPVPGHPWYRIWHKEQYVELPDVDLDGFRMAADSPTAAEAAAAAAAAKAKHSNSGSNGSDGSSSFRPSLDHGAASGTAHAATSVFARHGWHIPTITAMAGSLAGASSHSTLGSTSVRSLDSSSYVHASDCSNSNASGSAAATPLARRSALQHAHLDTIFSIDIDDSILDRQQYQQQHQQQQLQGSLHEPVYQLDTQASCPAIPHVTASSLRFRQVSSEDVNSPSAAASPVAYGSPNNARSRHLRLVVGSPVANSSGSHGSPQKQRPTGWESPVSRTASGGSAGTLSSSTPNGRSPPPSSVVWESEGQRALLPASLVRQYWYYPLVLVQLPMYNEEAHCEVVIERACNMLWPRHRVIIQVCDDSTREDVRRRIDEKVSDMCHRGHNCLVTRRDANKGFKAGNMLNGMEHVSKLPWEYVAIFDADFEMPPDWLFQTIWHLERDKHLAFVQTRWAFSNGYDNLLCWVQQVSLSFHFAVEQRARSFLHTFFGFNGTAGVWRRSAMEQAGGWNMDSTVEDMDLSLRAYLNGWKFRYLHWVACPNELPPTMSAYKTQQYRWNSGPMVVIKGLIRRIWTTDRVGFVDRISCTYFFFRFIYSAFLTVICLLCPAIIIWLDPWTWGLWGPEMIFLVAGNTAAAAFVWFAGLLFWPYFLLQCGVGYFRVYAMINGLRGSKKSGTWKVTAKFGKQKGSRRRPKHKPYLLELLLAAVFFTYTFWGVWYGVYLLSAFTWVVGWTLVLLSFGDYLF